MEPNQDVQKKILNKISEYSRAIREKDKEIESLIPEEHKENFGKLSFDRKLLTQDLENLKLSHCGLHTLERLKSPAEMIDTIPDPYAIERVLRAEEKRFVSKLQEEELIN